MCEMLDFTLGSSTSNVHVADTSTGRLLMRFSVVVGFMGMQHAAAPDSAVAGRCNVVPLTGACLENQ